MPLYAEGDRVKYVGDNLDRQEATIVGIKVRSSEDFGRPIYRIKLDDYEEPYKYGIHEHNLLLIKRATPIWEV